MNCSLTNKDRVLGIRCRSFTCYDCRHFSSTSDGVANIEETLGKMVTRKFKKKPVVVEVMTFDGMIQNALNQESAHKVDGVPWHFTINGYIVTHENDDRYLVSTLEGNMVMTRDDVLIIGINREIYPCKISIFNESYEEVL